ncbi:Hsp70 family protein [Methylobacterium gnaphalii]|uniref:Heat-shock protein n=1 Tax=Methylobacterium gnaphalii TaxID=1010610 RepID=A0A512JES9_9HYPH|nr:Hsp70 family protein [Methylobacterium gnaphalii]GEP08460.1 heat-shock protein [Methylobacterium gnaphalii]GJD68828.1 Chaperone protein DnaK [Methylobacterium gnaphalii]GLS47352.1 heat-shock protein [Methylobacterium gnaphalii]
MAACGLDFGTSNTTLGLATAGRPSLLPLEGAHRTIPSAIFFSPRHEALIGRAAIEAYVEGTAGRLMRSLKSVLGSNLIEESTPIGRERLRFREVIARYLAAVKQRAEAAGGIELDTVVHGRPVHFVDGDEVGDRKAEDTLRAIAGEVGFRHVRFQYEPIAAALDYEQSVEREEIALIADIGGGTSDFSIVRLSPERHRRAERAEDILANDGVRIGGTDFDRRLSLGTVMPLMGLGSPMKRADLLVPNGYFHDLATWSSINRLYDRKVYRELEEVARDAARPELIDRLRTVVEVERGHALAMAVEGAKIAASDRDHGRIDLDWVEPGLAVAVDRASLALQTGALAERIAERIGRCLTQAGLAADAIDAIFLTGGSTGLPHVRAALCACVPEARIVDGDTFGSVGVGLAIEAARQFGPARMLAAAG